MGFPLDASFLAGADEALLRGVEEFVIVFSIWAREDVGVHAFMFGFRPDPLLNNPGLRHQPIAISDIPKYTKRILH